MGVLVVNHWKGQCNMYITTKPMEKLFLYIHKLMFTLSNSYHFDLNRIEFLKLPNLYIVGIVQI